MLSSSYAAGAGAGAGGAPSFAAPLGEKNLFAAKAVIEDIFRAATPALTARLQLGLEEMRGRYEALHAKYYPEGGVSTGGPDSGGAGPPREAARARRAAARRSSERAR